MNSIRNGIYICLFKIFFKSEITFLSFKKNFISSNHLFWDGLIIWIINLYIYIILWKKLLFKNNIKKPSFFSLLQFCCLGNPWLEWPRWHLRIQLINYFLTYLLQYARHFQNFQTDYKLKLNSHFKYQYLLYIKLLIFNFLKF